MKISRRRLETIIKEEFNSVYENLTDKEKRELNTKRKQQQRKRDDMRYGGEEIRQLSVGIVGEDNNYFDEDGHFTSKEDAKTYSSYFIDGVRKNLKGSTPHKNDSGRGRKRSGQGKYKVDGTKKWESVDSSVGEVPTITLSMPEMAVLVDDCILSFLNRIGSSLQEDKIIEREDGIEWSSECARRGYRSFDTLLKAMNKIVLSSQGKLLGPGK